jgi:hypothetical protein
MYSTVHESGTPGAFVIFIPKQVATTKYLYFIAIASIVKLKSKIIINTIERC